MVPLPRVFPELGEDEQSVLEEAFQGIVSSPKFQQMDDEARQKLYTAFGRTYAAPKGAAMEKSLIPRVASDLSAATSGALSMKGGPVARLAGATLGFGTNRLAEKATGTEPEAANAANLTSLNPFGKVGVLKNAAMRAGESGAAALINNYEKGREVAANPALAQSPVNRSENPLTAAALAFGLSSGIGGGASALGSQFARRTGANKEIQAELEATLKANPGADPAQIARYLIETKGLMPKPGAQSVGPKVQPFGSETNLPGAATEKVGGVGKPKMEVFTDTTNTDIAPVSNQVKQFQENDIVRKRVADIYKRTGLDIKQLSEQEWKELKRYQKERPDAIYEEVLDPIFSAKSKDQLPAAAQKMKSNLDGLTRLTGEKNEGVKKGLGKAFVSRLVEESGDGRFANPETLLFRMEQIGKDTFNELLGSPQAFDSIKKAAEFASSQKSGIKGMGPQNGMLAFTKYGIIARLLQKDELGKDKEKLIALPWDKVIEKFATKKTVNLLSPGNQRFTRRAIDFESDEASESGAPIVPR